MNTIDWPLEMQKFLSGIVRHGGKAMPRALFMPSCSREQDKVRRKAKRLDWVRFKDGWWVITKAGRAAHDEWAA